MYSSSADYEQLCFRSKDSILAKSQTVFAVQWAFKLRIRLGKDHLIKIVDQFHGVLLIMIKILVQLLAMSVRSF